MRQRDRQLSGFSSEAIDELVGYRWPDNVDELSELVELSCRCGRGAVRRGAMICLVRFTGRRRPMRIRRDPMSRSNWMSSWRALRGS